MYVLYLDLDVDAVVENTGLDALDAVDEVDAQLEDLGFEKIGRNLYFTEENLTAVHDAIDTLTSLEMLEDAVMNAIVMPTSEISDFTEYFDFIGDEFFDDEEEEEEEEDDEDESKEIEVEIR